MAAFLIFFREDVDMKLSKVKTRLDRNQKQWSAKLRQGVTPRFMVRHSKSVSKVFAKSVSKNQQS